jgi:hypothetical protein
VQEAVMIGDHFANRSTGYSENDDFGLGHNYLGDAFKEWVDRAAALKSYGASLGTTKS